jgi:hypothetical protein
MKRTQILAGSLALLFSVGLVLQGQSGIQPAQATASAAAEITDLNTLELLKQAFQRDRGTVRLVTLLSPI